VKEMPINTANGDSPPQTEARPTQYGWLFALGQLLLAIALLGWVNERLTTAGFYHQLYDLLELGTVGSYEAPVKSPAPTKTDPTPPESEPTLPYPKERPKFFNHLPQPMAPDGPPNDLRKQIEYGLAQCDELKAALRPLSFSVRGRRLATNATTVETIARCQIVGKEALNNLDRQLAAIQAGEQELQSLSAGSFDHNVAEVQFESTLRRAREAVATSISNLKAAFDQLANIPSDDTEESNRATYSFVYYLAQADQNLMDQYSDQLRQQFNSLRERQEYESQSLPFGSE
jgi:hypothetical protein